MSILPTLATANYHYHPPYKITGDRDDQPQNSDPHWLGLEFDQVPHDRPRLIYRIMSGEDVHPDDVVVGDEFELEGLGPYPALTMGGSCVKAYDTALLKDCTAERMRIIAARYEGVNPKERLKPVPVSYTHLTLPTTPYV